MATLRLRHDDTECDCEGEVEDAGDWHAYLLFANAEDEADDAASGQLKANVAVAKALQELLAAVVS